MGSDVGMREEGPLNDKRGSREEVRSPTQVQLVAMQFCFVFGVLGGLFLALPLEAQPSAMPDAPPSSEPTFSPVCQLLGQLFHRSVASYEQDFGPIVFSRIPKFGDTPVQKYSGRTVAVHLAQHIMIGYFEWTGKPGEVITILEAEGQETLRRLGLDGHSREDVQRVLGQPHYLASGEPTDPAFRSRDLGEIGNKSLGYLCDRLPGDKQVDPPGTSSIGIDPVNFYDQFSSADVMG
jgi:hypothetical protein